MRNFSSAKKCSTYGLDKSVQFHKYQLDKVECAVLFQIHALKTAKTMFPNYTSISTNLNFLCRDLLLYYDQQNYGNVSIRMGNVVLSITLIQVRAKK